MNKKRIIIISSLSILILGAMAYFYIFTGRPLTVDKEFWDDSISLYKEMDNRMLTLDAIGSSSLTQREDMYMKKYTLDNLSEKEKEIYMPIINMIQDVNKTILDKSLYTVPIYNDDDLMKDYIDNQSKFKSICHLN